MASIGTSITVAEAGIDSGYPLFAVPEPLSPGPVNALQISSIQRVSRIFPRIFPGFSGFGCSGPLDSLDVQVRDHSARSVHFRVQWMSRFAPTTDGRELLLSRWTQPEAELKLVLERLKLSLPAQPPPKISSAQAAQANAV